VLQQLAELVSDTLVNVDYARVGVIPLILELFDLVA
jgi:hypothetical protein